MFTLTQRGKLLAFLALLALLVVLPVILYLQRQEQETRSKAEQSTTLSFVPSTTPSSPLSKRVGDTVSFDVMLDPGNNAVSFVKLEMAFDINKLAPEGTTPVQVDTSVFPEILEGPTIDAAGRIQVSVSIGSDATRAVRTPSRVATLTFKALSETGQQGPTFLLFGSNTQILSIGPNDQANENVYAGGTPAYLTINPPPCILPPPPSGNQEYYDTTILGSNEVPPNNSQASGFGRVRVDPANSSLVYVTFCYEGITGTVTEAGIHIAPPGQTSPTFISLPGSSDPNGNRDYVTDHPTSITPAWLQNLRDGLWYININSTGFPNGEIRGQFGTFVPPTPTPSPTIAPTNTPIPPTPTRTPTPTTVPTSPPTNTPAPFATSVSLTTFLHGIGNSGDSANPTNHALSNKNPLHTQRSVTVQVLNAQNVQVANASGTLTYNSSNGNFTGTVDLGSSVPTGSYTVKVKTNQYLRKLIPGILTLTTGQTNTLPSISLVAGDANDDNTINILDYNLIYGCYSDLAPARSCTQQQKDQTDLNDDGNVNQFDYNLFLRDLGTQDGD